MNNAGINFQYLLNMLAHPNQASKPKNKKIEIKQNFIFSQQQYNAYSDKIKNIYNQIFCDQDDDEQQKAQPVNLESKIKFPIKRTAMPVCNKILTSQQMVFRCYDCMTHQSSVICKDCFQKGNHKGHRYNQISSGGGNCDCGNPDAIKAQGFCIHHPGKAQPVIIDQAQQNHFLQITLTVFEWIFRMYQRKMKKSGDFLGQFLAEYLVNLNQQSLYYNTLTFKMLYSRRRFGDTQEARQQKLIDKIFEYGIQMVNLAKKTTDLFFNMFSLEVFKYELTVSFTEAYNKLQKFQLSKFKHLYIQLYANNDIVERLIQKQLVMWPYDKQYDYEEYMANLNFLGSIKQEVASKYFAILIQKGYIRCPELDIIQSKVQKGNAHIIQVTNENLNNENIYYTVLESIIGLVKHRPDILIIMLQNYSEIILSKKYSYQKNKLVMPFHKILGMIILALSNGELQNFSLKQYNQIITNQLVQKVFRLIFQCFRELSTTYFETSYFDSYLPLYVKSGNTIIVYDMLMLVTCLQMFEQSNNIPIMNEILKQLFQIRKIDNQQKKQKNQIQIQQKLQQAPQTLKSVPFGPISSQQQWQDLVEEALFSEPSSDIPKTQQKKQSQLKILRKNIQLIKLLIQTCISDRAEVLVSNSLKIQSQACKQKTQQLFLQLINNFKQISPQNLKTIQKNFIQTKNFESQLVKKFLVFDKTKKKYLLNQNITKENVSNKLPLHLYSTMKKMGGIFAVQDMEQQENNLKNIRIEKHHIYRLKIIFNEDFLEQLTQFYLGKLIEQQNNVESLSPSTKKVLLDFVQTMRVIQDLMGCQSSAINSFYKKITALSEKPLYHFLNQKLKSQIFQTNKQNEKQTKMKKFNQKKKKRLEEMKIKQQTFSQQIHQSKANQDLQENQNLCIICRQDNKAQGLAFLANYNYSNILQALNKVQGRSLSFNSCFHPIHINCFMKSAKQSMIGRIPCPLCKSQSNIMLPFQKQILNVGLVKQIFERISVLKTLFHQKYIGFDKKYEQLQTLCILRAICSMIGMSIVRNESILSHKNQRLSNTLYGIAQTMFQKVFSAKKIQQQQKGIQQFLQALSSKINYEKTSSTNYYSFQYVSLKILYLCFIQKPFLCWQILYEKCATLINKEELKKIWQMCNQIVSLPDFKLPNIETLGQVNQMNTIVQFYKPPQTVFQLIKIRDQGQMSCKNGHQMCICVMCQKKGCYQCQKITKHIDTVHCGEGLVFSLLTGGFLYFWENRPLVLGSFYFNDIGIQWKPSKQAQGFTFDNESYEELKNQILNESILKYIFQKYPQALKKGSFQMGFD